MREGEFKRRIAEHNKGRTPIFNPNISTIHSTDAFCKMIENAQKEFQKEKLYELLSLLDKFGNGSLGVQEHANIKQQINEIIFHFIHVIAKWFGEETN